MDENLGKICASTSVEGDLGRCQYMCGTQEERVGYETVMRG